MHSPASPKSKGHPPVSEGDLVRVPTCNDVMGIVKWVEKYPVWPFGPYRTGIYFDGSTHVFLTKDLNPIV